MKLNEKINSPHKIGLGTSPNEGDIAIVSIDDLGTPDRLNSLVLKEYGYSERDLPKANELKHGFSQIPERDRRAILFVVTISDRKTSDNLETNLFITLAEFRGWITHKKVWLPLMGTGDGGLTLEESYSITARTINNFQLKYPTETTFLISIPKSKEGQKLLYEITDSKLKINIENENLLKSLNCKFYLAGSYWGKEDDQIDRFIKNSIWEKGQDGKAYSTIINKVKIGDILFLKSTYQAKGISYIKIKAIGIVLENLRNGASLKVNWKITGLNIDIRDLGYYRDTIAEVKNNDDIAIIFDHLGRRILDILFSLNNGSQNKETIAGLISDTDKGIDYLDITKDVTAFSRVIAAKSFEPPLAIALFGKWGSGKSFFMRKLKEQIIKLQKGSKNGIYCKGIAHIHFNAWSYLDANLWASIVTKIFEGLNEYITDCGLPDEVKKEIEKQLTNKLSITKNEIGILEDKKESVEGQILELYGKKRLLNTFIESQIKKVKEDTVWKIIEKVDNEFKVKEKVLGSLKGNATYVKTEGELKKIIPEEYWDNPEKAYRQIKSAYTFIKEFFRKDKIICNLIWLAIILIIIGFTPLILGFISDSISKTNFIIPQTLLSFLVMTGVIWRRAKTVYSHLQPIITSFWKIKEDYEKQVNEAVSRFNQEEKALKLEIENGKSEILIIDEQIQKVETIRTELEFKINNSIMTESLFSFIDKRTKSDDYKKYLGIISTIRKDFEILNDLFIGHNLEVGKNRDAEIFRSKFDKPLERIILYVDDLDRCPEENVVQVLEAVNLLMAFPLFTVIVGVDPRWIKNALIKKHVLQLTGRMDSLDNITSKLEMIEPSDYLEKIFQIPFHLKDAKDSNVKDMIMQLAKSKPDIQKISSVNEPTFVTDTPQPVGVGEVIPENIDGSDTIKMNDNTLQPAEDELMDKPEALVLTENEIKVMQDMSEIIGNNPRAIKRFVNIFRIIKAHEEFNYDLSFENEELLTILFLLALPMSKYRKLLPSFEKYIQDETSNTTPIIFYLQSLQDDDDLKDLRHELDIKLLVKPNFEKLKMINASSFNKHNTFIRRFTFKNI